MKTIILFIILIISGCGSIQSEPTPGNPNCPPFNDTEGVHESFTPHFNFLPINIARNYINNNFIDDKTFNQAVNFWNECFSMPIITTNSDHFINVFLVCDNDNLSEVNFTKMDPGGAWTIHLSSCSDLKALEHEMGRALGFEDSESPSIMSKDYQDGIITQGIVDILKSYLSRQNISWILN